MTPESLPQKHVTNKKVISRRRAIRLGLEATAGVSVGVFTTAWVKPQVASVQMGDPRCRTSPPPGNPSIDLSKTARLIRRFGRQVSVSGKITIKNASEVQVIVEKLADTVQYRDGNKWKDAPTVLDALTDCGPGSCIDVGKRCVGEYTASATVPLSANRFRNRVEVKLMFRDKIFSYTADVEGSFDEPPPREEPPPSEPPPSNEPPPPSSEPPPPSSEPPPSEPPPSEPPPSEPPPSP
ncbi:MAG: hypothetical protein ACRDHO_03355 [Actinomycetota bacterium]